MIYSLKTEIENKSNGIVISTLSKLNCTVMFLFCDCVGKVWLFLCNV